MASKLTLSDCDLFEPAQGLDVIIDVRDAVHGVQHHHAGAEPTPAVRRGSRGKELGPYPSGGNGPPRSAGLSSGRLNRRKRRPFVNGLGDIPRSERDSRPEHEPWKAYSHLFE
jgi:hypothetical protein